MVISDKQIHAILAGYPGSGANAPQETGDSANTTQLSPGKQPRNQGQAAPRSDRVTLSGRAKEIAMDRSAATKATGGENADRLAGLAKAVADGTYRPGGLEIAGKMLGRAMADKLPE